MVARLIQQLPLDSLGDATLSKLAKNDDANQLIACEVSLFSSDISLGNQVIAKTRGAPPKFKPATTRIQHLAAG